MTSSALMQAILGATAQPEDNMYGFIGRTVGQAAPLMMDPYGSRGQNATYALGATLLSGLLGGLGQRRAAQENQMMQSQIARGLKDPSLWGQLAEENPRIASIANAAQLEQSMQAQEYARKQLERESDLEWKVRELEQTQPLKTRGAYGETYAREQAQADYQAKMFGGDPTMNPKHPGFMSEKDKIGVANTLRDEFRNSPITKTFKLQELGMRSLAKAMQDPSATSSVEIVRAAIQAIEPGLAVREDDQRAIAESVSIPEQLKERMRRALSGEKALDSATMQGLARIAARRYHENARQFDELRKTYEGISTRSKALPENVLIFGPSEPVKSIYPPGFDVEGTNETPGDIMAEFRQFQAIKRAANGG